MAQVSTMGVTTMCTAWSAIISTGRAQTATASPCPTTLSRRHSSKAAAAAGTRS
jgi:hypothetical protein